jgi:enoyl-CoA hydratase
VAREYVVTLNAPNRGNALSKSLLETIHLSIPTTKQVDRGQIFVLQARGRNFSTGFDFGGWREHSHGDLVLRFIRIFEVIRDIERMDCVTVARIQGRAYGSGADLAMACDYRVGTPQTRFRFPGFQFGVILGTRRLGQLVGTAQAQRLILDGVEISGAEALEVGLLTHLVDEDELPTWLPPTDPSVSMSHVVRRLLNPMDTTAELAALVTSVSSRDFIDRLEQYLSRLGM